MATCATPGSLSSDDHVADHEDLGVPGQGQVGVDLDPAGAVDAGAGLLGRASCPAGWPGRRPPRPCRPTRSGARVPSRVLDARCRVASTSTTFAPSWTSTPSSRSCRPALAPRLGRRTAPSTVRGGVEQDDAGARGCRSGGSRGAACGATSSAICPAISTPVGPAPTTTKVSSRSTLGRVVGQLGELERAEDAAAQLERVVDALHARGELGELVVAEVGLAGAGRDDAGCRTACTVRGPSSCGGDRARLEVDVGDLAEQHPGVVLAAQHLAGRRGDLALGQDAGGDLVEQRLEQVVGRLGDQRHVDVGVLQRLGGEEAAEAGPDDHHMVSLAGRCVAAHGLPLVRHCWSDATPTRKGRPAPRSVVRAVLLDDLPDGACHHGTRPVPDSRARPRCRRPGGVAARWRR